MTASAEEAAFQEAAAASERMFWLDGGGARPWSGSRSVLGVLGDDDVSLTFDAGARTVLRHQRGCSDVVGDDIFAVLEEEVARDGGDPGVSWVGYLGYACRTDLPATPLSSRPSRGVEPPLVPAPSEGVGAPEGVLVPDAVWMRVPRTTWLTATPLSSRPSRGVEPPLEPVATSTRGGSTQHEGQVDERYAAAFAEVQRQLRLGNSYEVNLTYREQVESLLDPVAAYLRLRRINPAPYSGYLQHRGVHLLSSSPERFATVDRHRTIEARPIKGTTPRGATAEDDERHRRHLATEPKFRAENLMIVDLLRNDLSMVCDPGTVSVPSLMEVESYESVHQLVSTVRGRLREEVSTVGALRALFPAGSMTGAPKRRTMEIIEAVEATPRGAYAGAFGWLSGDGRADLSVVIRTLVTSTRGGSTQRGGRLNVYELGTGGGITVRSRLEEEWAETRWKAARLRAAVEAGPTP